MDFETAAEREAVRLHEFLQDWLTGALARTPEVYDGFHRVFAPEFLVISPRGTVTERAALVDEFEGLHGQLADRREAFRIEVRNFRARHRFGEVLCATYEEWHELAGNASARLTTVLMRPRAETPLGVEWVHIHETWLPGKAPVAGERFPEEG